MSKTRGGTGQPEGSGADILMGETGQKPIIYELNEVDSLRGRIIAIEEFKHLGMTLLDAVVEVQDGNCTVTGHLKPTPGVESDEVLDIKERVSKRLRKHSWIRSVSMAID